MQDTNKPIIVVGAGLAGSECAWQLANAGFKVHLFEMRPVKTTNAHVTDQFAELVCSNSLRSDNASSSAVGVLHQELRHFNSLIIKQADTYKVPAGDALAVDRTKFSASITNLLSSHPNITIFKQEFTNLLEYAKTNIVIIATGPLTSKLLYQEIDKIIDYTGYKLNFFDAIAPVVYTESIDFSKAWLQSRYDKGNGDDYINCALNKEEYTQFYNQLINAEYVQFEEWEKDIAYFEGCLPIEEMAKRGFKTLLFGPMKPIGLTNANNPTEKPFAVVQLRQDNTEKTLYNIVGFQTKLKYQEQKRVFSYIPALKNAEFAKLGGIHKNTYINAPALLNTNLSLKNNTNIYFAGQITGCEGYVESCSIGLTCALFVIAKLKNIPFILPNTTAMYAMLKHVTLGNIKHYEPRNINFGLFENFLTEVIDYKNKKESKLAMRSNIAKQAITDSYNYSNIWFNLIK